MPNWKRTRTRRTRNDQTWHSVDLSSALSSRLGACMETLQTGENSAARPVITNVLGRSYFLNSM